jgi:hypothetical protein
MPHWKVHLLFNFFIILVWIFFLLNLGLFGNTMLMILLIFLSSFFSILPDIDSPKSKIRDFFAVIIASFIVVYFVFNFSFNSLLYVSAGFIFLYLFFRFFPTKHRGLTHNFWFSIFMTLIFTIILSQIFSFSLKEFFIYFFFILSGYLSHLFLDALF